MTTPHWLWPAHRVYGIVGRHLDAGSRTARTALTCPGTDERNI
ncbi:MAG TPA: hypothetical protein VGS06_29415 [Streptosporangiaceae bacterium]|nr:hypothetical protein [Streptosporangiaceae bacterium]